MATRTPRPIYSQYNSQESWEAAMDKWLQERMEEDNSFDEEDRYDAYGNVSSSGIYDAGGHLIENWYDYVDEDAGRDR